MGGRINRPKTLRDRAGLGSIQSDRAQQRLPGQASALLSLRVHRQPVFSAGSAFTRVLEGLRSSIVPLSPTNSLATSCQYCALSLISTFTDLDVHVVAACHSQDDEDSVRPFFIFSAVG